MPVFLGISLGTWLLGGAGAGLAGLLGWKAVDNLTSDNDEPVSAEERKTARSKMMIAAIGAAGVWAYFKFKGKKR